MSSIVESIETIRKSNYFDAWHSILLSDNSYEQWKEILDDNADDAIYDILAKQLHGHNVPYVIVSEYIDEFYRYYDFEDSKHRVKNRIAEAYLKKRLTDDKLLLDIEITKKIAIPIESKQKLINAHIVWMKNFICNIIGEPVDLELDYKKCYVGKWLLEEIDTVSIQLFEKHKNLHSMAQSAMRMYHQNDYAYFLLLYSDILSMSYQMRDSIMNIYFSRRINTIFEDPLTGKANYFQLKMDLQDRTTKKTILMFNIKEFSKINLLYGHEVGDRIIVAITKIVSKSEAVYNTYRIYGDEFAVIFESENKIKLSERIMQDLHEFEFDVPDNKISLSFYSSIADFSDHVLEHCEYGLMMSKKHHGEMVDVNIIKEDVFTNYANEITLSQQLRLAFLDNRILIYFQPIYDFKTKKISKYEVLMRIEDINSNILEPKDFLKILKEMYIYPEVTKLIMQKSFEFFQNNEYEFSVNLSFSDLVDEDTKIFILMLADNYPEVAKRCTVELLEQEAILNVGEVSEFFDNIHQCGMKIALDDFGVGYSNYDSIFKFEIDYIKIDGSLAESILTSKKSKVLVESIITVSKMIDAKIIVEYVSSKEIFDYISGMDVDYAQGYYIGKPSESLELSL